MEEVLLIRDVITPPFFVKREAGQQTAGKYNVVNAYEHEQRRTELYRVRGGENGEHLTLNSCVISRKRVDFSASYAVDARLALGAIQGDSGVNVLILSTESSMFPDRIRYHLHARCSAKT